METMPWLMIAIAVLLVVFAIIAIIIRRKNPQPPDYYAFFWIGLVWIIFGLPSIFTREYSMGGLFVIGLVFFIIGLANRDKWKQNRRTWNDLTSREQKLKIVIMIILGILVLAGLAAYYLVEKGII